METTYNLPSHKRGDTYTARVIAVLTNTDTDAPVAIASARLQVRRQSGRVVHEWTTEDDSMTISGAGDNVLTLARVEAEDTADWPPGVHDYDLEITLADDDATTFTAPEGTFEITADVTRD